MTDHSQSNRPTINKLNADKQAIEKDTASQASFLSRWSRRKLVSAQRNELNNNSFDDSLHTETNPTSTTSPPTSLLTSKEVETVNQVLVENTVYDSECDDLKKSSHDAASLLATNLDPTTKKNALRQLFLNTSFQDIDPLDDYNQPFQQVESLSIGVVKQLRSWLNEHDDDVIDETKHHYVNTDATQEACVKESEEQFNEHAPLEVTEQSITLNSANAVDTTKVSFYRDEISEAEQGS